MVLVWDRVAGVPVAREAGDQDESGRGLSIVAGLSGKQWECYPAGGTDGGKVTKAVISQPWRDQLTGEAGAGGTARPFRLPAPRP